MKINLAFLTAILCGCTLGATLDTTRVPLGTWKEHTTERYISIELADESAGVTASDSVSDSANKQHQYLARLFSFSERGARLERQAHAVVKDGILTLLADGVQIPMLYHPSKQLILINGKNEYSRFLGEPNSRALVNLQEAKHE